MRLPKYKHLEEGQRIKVNIRMMSGWKGYGTVVIDEGNFVWFVKEGRDPRERLEWCYCRRDEVTVCRPPKPKSAA